MVDVFNQISIVIFVVLIFSFITRFFKQPLIIGYIISGIVLGPFFLGILPQLDTINIFSQFGIAFLLFIVGLHLSPRGIKDVGKISLITGIGQILFTAVIGYFLGILLGFSQITSLYIAIALTFSSTIIIMKLLSDKGDLDNLYSKISIGFLLVQDLVAILALIIVSSFSRGENIIGTISLTFIKGIILVAILVPISIFILPKFQRFFAHSQELLFVFSISWGLGLAALFHFAGLSIEVGALIAGVLLSVSPYSLEISSKLKPLRDFFIISFFLLLGAQITVNNFTRIILPSIAFSLLILIGNPLIVMILMGLDGYTRRTSFLAGLTVAQIGEFSLIFVALGAKVGHISNEILSLITLVSLITISICTYMVIYSNKLYSLLSKNLYVFERKKIREKRKIEKNVDVILFGYNRIGFGILNSLKKIKQKYLVIDFNPDTVANLTRLRIPCIYGDADDESLLKELPLKNIKIVISTIPEVETNELILNTIKWENPKSIVIVRAHTIEDAMYLYEKGADYVLTPHFLGGEYLAEMIKRLKTETKGYIAEKEKHIKMLTERFQIGQKHPEVLKD